LRRVGQAQAVERIERPRIQVMGALIMRLRFGILPLHKGEIAAMQSHALVLRREFRRDAVNLRGFGIIAETRRQSPQAEIRFDIFGIRVQCLLIRIHRRRCLPAFGVGVRRIRIDALDFFLLRRKRQ